MKKRLLFVLLLLATLPFATIQAGTPIGYSNGDCGRNNIFRSGSTEKQGVAIKLPHEKLQLLKGCSISGVEAAFGSRNTTNYQATAFISVALADTPVAEVTDVISRAAKWQTFTLATPYVISGEEEALYIGYTVETTTKNHVLSCDYTNDFEGCCYIYTDGEWEDMYGKHVGSPNVRAIVENVPAFTDLTIKKLNVSGYYKQGGQYVFGTQIFNFGTTDVTNFDVTLKVGDAAPQVISYNNTIPAGGVFDIVLPEYAATETGDLGISLEISSVNGGKDMAESDNTTVSNVFFYPENMERNLLLEGFTGQECPNCPAGHRTISDYLASTDVPIVEVMHHIGYYPDMYTMMEDGAYLNFYGSSTFAPAFMMNRTQFAANDAPIMNVGKDLLAYATNEAWNCQPYVSLKLESSYNPITREVKVNATAYGHTNLPTENAVINVMLIQDNMVGAQSNGGTGYVHTNVFRGTLGNNPWGKLLFTDFKEGSTASWEETITLPEAIKSSYWTESLLASKGWTEELITLPTDPENMYLVAYVGSYDANNIKNNFVYNCVKVKLGESHEQAAFATAIEPTLMQKGAEPKVRTEGRNISVEGDYDYYNVYNAAGMRQAANRALAPGMYVIQIQNGKKTYVKKLMIK